MFDIGWSEMAVIFMVALIIIGPRDLPRVARTVGKWTGKARAMARDFQRSIDDMVREAELDEIKKSVNKVGSTNMSAALKDVIDPKGEIEDATNLSGALDEAVQERGGSAFQKPKAASEPGSSVGVEQSSAAPITRQIPAAKANDTETG